MSISQINWRGPRPLAPGDILRGRDGDLRLLSNKARSFDVLEITAASGVGKSSFIAAGLVRRLEENGSVIIPSRDDWSWSSVLTDYDKATTEPVDAELLYRLCLDWSPSETKSIEDEFDEVRKKGRPVVVLDQFEELIRYRERLGEALLEFIGETATDVGVTHIVAARSEYRDRFRPMEDACGSFFHWPLPVIDDEEAVDDIITAPVVAAGLSIESDATKLLRSGWKAARDQPAAELDATIVGRADVGLLHLQGVLWLFQQWLTNSASVPDDTSMITTKHVRDFATAYNGLTADDTVAPRLFHRALVEYVRKCCDGLHSASTDIQEWKAARGHGGVQWNNGPRLMMAKSAHLFSVLGYKVAQSRSGMFQTVLSEDMEPPTARAVAASAAISRSIDWLPETAAKHGHEVKGRGIAIEWTGEEVLTELLAAATQAWAAAALTGTNVLRRFVQADEDVYELVHDGMGHALQEWARQELLEPRSILGVITQRAGKSLHLPLEPATFLTNEVPRTANGSVSVPDYWHGFASVDDAGFVAVNGLGWDASLITSSISDVVIDGWTLTGALLKNFNERSRIDNVVFRRCDFRGAAIREVTLSNVRFEQCNLHGASMSDCTLDGVEFVHADDDGTINELSSIDLFSFVRCAASGRGVSLRSLRDVKGLLFDKVEGGPWVLEGTDVRHVAMDGDTVHGVEFKVGPGSYGHITVAPEGLAIEVDPAAVVTASDITVADRPGS